MSNVHFSILFSYKNFRFLYNILLYQADFCTIFYCIRQISVQYSTISGRFLYNILLYPTDFCTIFYYIRQISVQYSTISGRFLYNILLYQADFCTIFYYTPLDINPLWWCLYKRYDLLNFVVMTCLEATGWVWTLLIYWLYYIWDNHVWAAFSHLHSLCWFLRFVFLHNSVNLLPNDILKSHTHICEFYLMIIEGLYVKHTTEKNTDKWHHKGLRDHCSSFDKISVYIE